MKDEAGVFLSRAYLQIVYKPYKIILYNGNAPVYNDYHEVGNGFRYGASKMKVFHINILDDEQAVKELNHPTTGGWSSQPRFARYSDITLKGNPAQAALSWLVGEYTQVAEVDTLDLEDAWENTQNIQTAWTLNVRVTAEPRGIRSSMVGDIIEDNDGHLHLIAHSGFKDIDPVGLAKRSTLDELI